MRNGIRAVTIFLIAAMVAVCVAGCSLFGGKARSEITAAAEIYAQAIKDYDVDAQTRHMEPGHNAVSTLEESDLQREIFETVMSASSFEIRNVQGNTKEAVGSADIVFIMPDLEALAASEEAQGYSKMELLDAISNYSQKTESTITVNFVYEFGEWLVCADSTETTANFIAGVGKNMEVKAISDAEATAVADSFINLIADGDIDAAAEICTDPTGTFLDEDMRNSLPEGAADKAAELYAEVLSDFDYETSVSALDETSVLVTLTGTAPDVADAKTDMTNDEAAMIGIYTAAIDSAVNGTEFDPAVIYDVLITKLATAGVGPFEISVIVSVDEAGNKSVMFDSTSEGIILLDTPESLLYDEEISGTYIPLAAQSLLDEEIITQDQYSEITGRYSFELDSGITVEYEGGDNCYDFGYEVKDDGILIRVTTWGFYDQGTQFDYEVLREPAEGESETVSGEAGIAEDGGDDMYLTVDLTEDEFEMGGTYTVTVFDEDGESVLASVIISIPVPEEEEEETEEEASEENEEGEAEAGEEGEGESTEETSETEETTEET